MNANIKLGVSVACSLFFGAFIGYKFGIKKAQKFADEQVQDTKEALKKYYKENLKSVEKETKTEEKIDIGEDPRVDDAIKGPNDAPLTSRERFHGASETIQHSDVMERPKDLPPTAIDTPDGYPDPENKNIPPYLIREEDYGSLDDWDTLDLILWKCNTVTTDDSFCEVVSPTILLKLLPENWPNMFGWGNDDKYKSALYFRNNADRRDIQILKDNRTYKEWIEEVYPGRLDELEDE